MLNFTVGPVMLYDRTKKIAGENSPYFRTPDFSALNLESEQLLKKLQNASDDYKCAFLTGSGTFGMETSVVNILKSYDKVLVVNGGTFGHRFVDLMTLHHINFTSIDLEFGHTLKEEDLIPYANKGYTAFAVNIDETSSGVLYDMDLISKFCKENNLILIADAIASFICDELYVDKWGIDCVITASQKAFALQPGLSTLTLSPRALERVYDEKGSVNDSLYFDLKYALENQKRGQTSYTPCVSTFIQMNDRLKMLSEVIDGKLRIEIERDIIKKHAYEIREYVKTVPHYSLVADKKSNCVTSIYTEKNDAKYIFDTLVKKYNMWICPNGGKLSECTFRIGHIGNITDENNRDLINALKEING